MGHKELLATASLLLAASVSFADDGGTRVVVGFKGRVDSGALSRCGASVADDPSGARTVVAHVPAGKIASLRAEPSVAYVEEDGVVEASARPGTDATTSQPAQSTPWGISKVRGNAASSVNGSGVKVAVIDTGIDLTHPDLAANIKGNATFVAHTSSGNDDNGHGTHVAGTIGAIGNSIGVIGVAPAASLYAVKVLDRRGSGWDSAVAAGIDWARINGMNIASMSLGGPSSSTVLQTACDSARNAGVLVIAAAGNEGDGSTSTTELSYPAAYDSVVAVGATDINDQLASFSNTGSFVEISAPGVSVLSTYKGGTYATGSGTSMATPHVSGLAALLWNSVPSGSTIRDQLHTHVKDLGPTGLDAGFGYGRAAYTAGQ